MKRLTLALLVFVLAVAGVWAAGKADTSAAGSPRKEFNAMMIKNVNLGDLPKNDFTMHLEERTGVRINWVIVPDSTAVTLAFTSGDLPDFTLGYMNIDRNMEMRYASNGLIVALNPYIKSSMPEYSKILRQFPELEKALTLPDGSMYHFPNIAQDNHGYVGSKAWVYQPWLNKLGLKVPTTTEEFRQMLRAFKTEDPNGNGIADEIPMSGAIKTWRARPDDYLMNAFVHNDSGKRFRLTAGKVELAAIQPEWKQGLLYINQLYQEGLIDPAAYTQDLGQLGSLAENKGVNILGSYGAGHLAMAWGLHEGGRAKDGVQLLPLRGPSGRQVTPFGGIRVEGQATPSLAAWPATFITSACSDPQAVAAWIDYFYTEEGSMRSDWGVKGEHWRDALPGEVGMLGQPAVWSPIEKHIYSEEGVKQNYAWPGMHPGFYGEKLRLGMAQGPDAYEVLLTKVSQQYQKFIGKEDFPGALYVPLQFADELAQLQTVITNHINESMVRFITGDRDINTQWDAYVKEIENMGLKRYLQIYEDAFAKQYGN